MAYAAASAPTQVYYGVLDAATATGLKSNSAYTAVTSCTTNLCNCGASCFNPFTSACPTTGASGSLQCRVGAVGTFYDDETGATSTMTAGTYGNLASQAVPTGSLCMSFSYNGSTQDGPLTAVCV